MSHKLKLTLTAAACILLCGLCLSPRAAAQATLPEGTGKAEFIHNCTACHLAELVVAAKKTPEDWRKSVDDMAARGTDGTKEDLDKVVLYLDKYYSLDKPAPTETPHPNPPSTSSALTPLNRQRLKQIFTEPATTQVAASNTKPNTLAHR